MSKNKKVMSIAILPDLHDELKKYSKRKGLSASAYVGNLIEQAVKLNMDDDPMVIGRPIDEEVTPIIIKMPVAFKSDPAQLQEWLTAQMNGILRAVVKKNSLES